MKKKYFARVDRQVALLIIALLFVSNLLIYFVSNQIYQNAIKETLIERIGKIYEYVDDKLRQEDFLNINSKADMEKESYQKLKTELEVIRDIGNLMYIYTAKKNEAGQLVYVIDGLPETAGDFRYPGNLIEEEIQSELEEALEKNHVILPKQVLNTGWGEIFIAYYPLHGEDGQVVGALGIEVSADVEVAAVKKMTTTAAIACGAFCMLAAVISIFIFRRISNPLYKDMVNMDFMTRLKNRNAYETDRNNLDVRKNYAGLAVVVIDLNNLKLVNDRLGHDVGDECIAAAAETLKEAEAEGAVAYRYGGDEFLLLMPKREHPQAFLSQMKDSFKKHVADIQVPVALAIGYAEFDEALDREIMDTQKRADELMYQDKIRTKSLL